VQTERSADTRAKSAAALDEADGAPALGGLQARKPAPSQGSLLLDAARSGNLPEMDRLRAMRSALDTPDGAGRTPLMLAVINGHAEAVERLLAAGASQAPRDHAGLTALQHAQRLGRERIAQMLAAKPGRSEGNRP
jgi:ankyrin repeat protein